MMLMKEPHPVLAAEVTEELPPLPALVAVHTREPVVSVLEEPTKMEIEL